MTTKQRRSFTREFRAEAVKLVVEHRMTMAKVSRELGVGESVLGHWVHKANVDAGRGPPGVLTTPERDELARQLGELRMVAAQRGWTATEHVDEGVSGSKDRRPGLDRLMTDARGQSRRGGWSGASTASRGTCGTS